MIIILNVPISPSILSVPSVFSVRNSSPSSFLRVLGSKPHLPVGGYPICLPKLLVPVEDKCAS
ncbi:MAG: hypothetical protein AB1798_22200, partial [Spirochaetota bacterium]